MKYLKHWRSFPFVLALTAYWATIKFAGMDTALSSPNGLLVVLGAFVVMAVEFYKSGDIGLRSFGMDMAFSVVQLIVCTSIVTILATRSAGVSAPDVILCIVVVMDAWFSPFNSFRTALRNWSAQVGGSSPSETQ